MRSLVVVCLLGSLAACHKGNAEPAKLPPPEVVVETVHPEDVTLTSETVGSIDGMVNAEIRARVPGYVQTQAYKDGSFVKKGDLLFVIEPALTEAAAKRAKGDKEAARAALERANADLARITPLAAAGVSSQQELEHARAAKSLAEAQLTSTEGAYQTAATNLSYTRIVAPISGLAGLARVRVGTLVGQGEPTLLTTVSQIDPVRVAYSVSEQQYLANPAKYRQGAADPELELFLADGSRYPHKGTFSFVDRQVNPATGTLSVMATFPNPEGLLRPGLYAKVRDVREVRKGALLVPQRAVAELQGTTQVVVVGKDDRAETRTVSLGERVGSRWLVLDGLQPGERYVVEGLQKARAGQPVRAVTRAADAGAPPAPKGG